ncbi:hypothetical protein PU629_02670 [Pullulanibacillus sp. KACC 23026]|uniref:hypothetical protein n=1 Tax=Pullulanibacillus sp. KACC 23026 TaxID=3028315 RepID=UPI0023AF81EC|nr:hypothetical protein [Pullulanibacillus sp. KACC 23026]WEG13286.1 hypothetical protein PU629_02670 [Pullulanibacillus sp. KACC 23026]
MSFPASIEELDRIKRACISMVNKRAAASGAISAIPLPGVDIASDFGILMNLTNKINAKFGLTPEIVDELDDVSQSIIYTVLDKTGKKLIYDYLKKRGISVLKKIALKNLKKQAGKEAAKSLGKFVPFIGPIAAAGIGFTSMKIAGHLHINECYEIVKRVIEEKEKNAPGY